MRRLVPLALLAACPLAVAALPRWTQERKEAGRVRLSLYRVAPGQQLAFLRWLAAREQAASEAGVPAAPLYAHLDGDAWDFAVLWPVTTPEQDRKLDEVLAQRGLTTGFAAALEFRQFLAWHSDTVANGPTTAAELLAETERASATPAAPGRRP
jgi:hypothetical protein